MSCHFSVQFTVTRFVRQRVSAFSGFALVVCLSSYLKLVECLTGALVLVLSLQCAVYGDSFCTSACLRFLWPRSRCLSVFLSVCFSLACLPYLLCTSLSLCRCGCLSSLCVLSLCLSTCPSHACFVTVAVVAVVLSCCSFFLEGRFMCVYVVFGLFVCSFVRSFVCLID